MRCDSQQPCQRCKQKSLSCEYTRTGYSDPYGLFQLKDTAVAPPSIQSTQLPQQYMDRFVDFNASEIHTAREQYPSAQQLSSSEPVNTGKHPQLELAPSDVSISTDCLDTFTMPPYTSVGLEVPLEDLGWEQFLNMPGNRDFSPFSLTCSVQGDVVDVFAQRAPEPGLGFTLQQIDPIEAKCIEIRKYLDNIRPDLAPDPVSTYLTRDRLVEGIELYGKYFQPVVPVLHVPTFELVKAPPVLLLTMMLVGRCYSRVGVSAANIQQWAIHLLLTIESSMHDKVMDLPPLAVIQASSLLSHVLGCTPNPTAHKFAAMHQARTFSMADGAGLFDAVEDVDYRNLNEDTFDWGFWVEGEMRRRLAGHIFVADVGNCLFTKTSPHLSPFKFDVQAPCYQSCWEAPTASECLARLQRLPPPMAVSKAVKTIRSASIHSGHLFDMSDFGMLEIVIGLCGILFNVIEGSLDHENNIPRTAFSEASSAIPTLTTLLQRDLCNHNIANIANDLVGKYGSDAMKRANHALNVWRLNWDLRSVHDVYDEKNSAFNHPLNYWLLARLFVVLHFFRNHNYELEDSTPPNAEFAAFSSANGRTATGKIRIQREVVKWLARIRQRQEGETLSAENFLSQVINTG